MIIPPIPTDPGPFFTRSGIPFAVLSLEGTVLCANATLGRSRPTTKPSARV